MKPKSEAKKMVNSANSKLGKKKRKKRKKMFCVSMFDSEGTYSTSSMNFEEKMWSSLCARTLRLHERSYMRVENKGNAVWVLPFDIFFAFFGAMGPTLGEKNLDFHRLMSDVTWLAIRRPNSCLPKPGQVKVDCLRTKF